MAPGIVLHYPVLSCDELRITPLYLPLDDICMISVVMAVYADCVSETHVVDKSIVTYVTFLQYSVYQRLLKSVHF